MHNLPQVADSAAVALATSAGGSLKDTAIAVIQVLVPLGVGVYVARKAFGWAKSFIH